MNRNSTNDLLIAITPKLKERGNSIARRCSQSHDVELIVQAGTMAASRAIETYDRKKANGKRLENWMLYKARLAMKSAARAKRFISRKHTRIEQARLRLSQELQRTPTDAEIADALGCSEVQIEKLHPQEIPLSSINTPAESVEDPRGNTENVDLREDLSPGERRQLIRPPKRWKPAIRRRLPTTKKATPRPLRTGTRRGQNGRRRT